MEMKLLKLAVERLYDQVEKLNGEIAQLKHEMADLRDKQPAVNLTVPPTVMLVENEYLDTKEVQRMLGVCYNTLRKVVDDGHIKPIRINQRRVRYNKADVIRYLEHGS
jgi:excisionase family DNA binding protein